MSERNEPADPRHEEALAAALRAEAESVRTAGDGLVRIRARVQRRRLRNRVLVPIATSAAVAATVTAVVATGLLASPHKADHAVVSLPTSTVAGPSHTPAVVSSAPSTVPPATSGAPSGAPSGSPASKATAVVTTTSVAVTTQVVKSPPPGPAPVWPFADQSAADAWQQTAASSPDQWHLDARNTAVRFVASVMAQLRLPSQGILNGSTHLNGDGSATVVVTRSTGNATITLGTVALSHWSTGAAAPWGVVDVTSPAGSKFPLTITSPTAEAKVSSPLAVTVDMVGVEDDDYVSAVTSGGGQVAPVQHAVWGSGGTVTLPAGVPTSGRGYVVVADGSSGQGAFGLSRLAVTPVEFGTPFNPLPNYVAVVNGTLRVFDTTTNAEVQQLAPGTKGVTQVAVSDDLQWVYYLAPGGFSGFMRTRLNGTGEPMTMTSTDGMQRISGFGVSGPHDEGVAYIAPLPAGNGQRIISAWSSPGAGSYGKIDVSTSLPPEALNVAIAPGGKELMAYVKTGTQGNVETFALPAAHTLADGRVPDACAVQACRAGTYAPNGDALLVQSTGQRLTVLRSHAGQVTELFHVAAAFGDATVDVDPTGTKVLLTDGLGHAWSWSGAGAAKALPGSLYDASW